MAGKLLSPKDEAAAREVQTWLGAISAYEREFKTWENRVEKIVKIYRDHDSQADKRNDTSTVFNILWSNVQVLLPATFARLPKPDVSRRFRDNDPVGRVAALILERGLDYEIDHYPDYRSSMENSVLDRFLGGRGTAWVRYEPHIVAVQTGEPEEGLQVTTDTGSDEQQEEAAEPQEEIENECSPVDYVHWKDFGHKLGRTWEEVDAIWRKVYMGRAALIKRFGEEVGSTIPLDTKPDESKKSAGGQDVEHQALIYEIWDKAKKEALWLSKSMGQIVEKKPDPLNLDGFYPCPKPLFATITSDSLTPVPDYKLYQDQARELNTLAERIDGLIDMLVVKGVHDAAVPELARLFKEAGNGSLIPVKNFAAFAEKQGLRGSVELFDIAPIVAALNQAYEAVDKVKNQIYEIMGIADIVRGSSDPGETLGAQKMKGQFGNMRLRGMQGRVIQFATELLQIKAQIMCKHYQPETLMRIAAVDQLSAEDKELVPQALQLLLGPRAADPNSDTDKSPLAGFRVEVSSDSMVQMDEAQEKADRTDFLNAVGSYFQKALPVVQQSPQAAPLVVGLLKFGVTGFKVGKTVEGMIDNVLDQLMKAAQNPQPKPNPDIEKIQAQAQTDQQQMQLKAEHDQQVEAARQAFEREKMQMQFELDKRKADLDAGVAQAEQQAQAAQAAQQNQLEAQREMMKAQHEQALEQMRMSIDKNMAEMHEQMALLIARLNNAAKVEVAEITAQTTLDAAQISAARQGTGEE